VHIYAKLTLTLLVCGFLFQ